VRLPFVVGNARRLARDVRKDVAALEDVSLGEDRICTSDLAERLASLAARARRAVGVVVTRHGSITHAVFGRQWPGLAATMRARRRHDARSGLRLILAYETGDAHPTEADIQLIDDARLDLIVTVGSGTEGASEAFVAAPGEAGAARVTGPLTLDALEAEDLRERIAAADAVAVPPRRPDPPGERAVLVGVVAPSRASWSTDETLLELRKLAETAGAEVVDVLTQVRRRPDPASLIGRGKVAELRALTERESADLVIFDEELSPAQERTLEDELGIKVLDRTALVLDIFARRARTREGRLQVELAQMMYLLPRLTGRGALLSRLGGGIGTRGPGETKLESDRRRIRARVTELRRQIGEISRVRHTQRGARQGSSVPTVALVGYTNAGKSTLLNRLTGADAYTEDKLFATLDPTARRLRLPNGRDAVLVDTVGFIQKLPTQLVAAFRATLEEVAEADVLLHVIDVSNPSWPDQRDATEAVLRDLGAADKPVVYALNKADRGVAPAQPGGGGLDGPESAAAILVSAKAGTGLEALLRAVAESVPGAVSRAAFALPYEKVGLMQHVYGQGRVLREEYGADGVRFEVEAPDAALARIRAALSGGAG
jgi:GTP-binding protein HflX